MNPILKNTLAIIAGLLVGSVVNMYIVSLSTAQLGLDAADPAYMSKLGDILKTASWELFIYPFAAHAVGTFIGALAAAIIAATHKIKIALVIGAFFLLGGIMASYMIPSPVWFIVLDLVCAYIPMAYLAGYLVQRFKKSAI